jgi:hypothetical protein
MKTKLFILAAVCAIAFNANAQTEKGKKLIGGNLSFTTQTSKGMTTGKVTSLAAGPNFAFFVKNNLALGLQLHYSYGKDEPYQHTSYIGSDKYDFQSSGSINESYGFSPYVRYYMNITETFKFFGQFALKADFGKYKTISIDDVTTDEVTYQNFGTNISPGFALFPSKKLAIEFSFPLISFTHQKNDYEGIYNTNSKINTFTFAATSFNPTIGMSFHF